MQRLIDCRLFLTLDETAAVDVDDERYRFGGWHEPEVEALFRKGSVSHVGIGWRDPGSLIAPGLQCRRLIGIHFLFQSRVGSILPPLLHREPPVAVQIGIRCAFQLSKQEGIIDLLLLRQGRRGKHHSE